MPRFTCLLPGRELSDPKEDFRSARKIEQYRLGALALYLPRGLSWEYLPLDAVTRAERCRRVVSAGHCVTVREEKPALDLWAGKKSWTLNLEKPASAQSLLDALSKD